MKSKEAEKSTLPLWVENGKKDSCRKITNKMIEQMKILYEGNKISVVKICKSFGISRSAFYGAVLNKTSQK
ncbi:MAG: helix-turn-helix domain-containing protein [Gammaproteobacteria bacterium]|nr:helix-turn-helix domain-containing protein [Gammaproteobacteria bacterium]